MYDVSSTDPRCDVSNGPGLERALTPTRAMVRLVLVSLALLVFLLSAFTMGAVVVDSSSEFVESPPVFGTFEGY
ncbi:MAG: hypothetical protein MUC96_16545 [Myxococcaceae bacterium]|nr:hypothetical protein [Myxococcaceae bacterium]